MKQNEHKRIKHGHVPGDIAHRHLVRMRERLEGFWVWPWQFINENCIKSFRRVIHDRSKKRQRRRDKKAIQEGLDEDV